MVVCGRRRVVVTPSQQMMPASPYHRQAPTLRQSRSQESLIAQALRDRDARNFALDQMQRYRLDVQISHKVAAANRRMMQEREAIATKLLEAGYLRDKAIERAVASKHEQEARKMRQVAAESAELERERVIKVKKAQEARDQYQREIAEHNAAEEEKRQQMLLKVAEEEALERMRKAKIMVEHEAAGRRRLQAVAVQREEIRLQRAAALEVQLRRARVVKAAKEAWVEQQIKVAAAERMAQAERRRAVAAQAKVVEQEAYARRNAAEEEKRIHMLQLVAEREAEEQLRVAAAAAAAKAAGERRVASVASLNASKVAERAARVSIQLERAVYLKAQREVSHQAEVEAKVRAREVERRRRIAKAQEVKQQQQRYYAERNAAHDAKFEEASIAHFHRQASRLAQSFSQDRLLDHELNEWRSTSGTPPLLTSSRSTGALLSSTYGVRE